MRISQSMLYDNFISYLNSTTSKLQKLYEMGASQKKINRPSDNPAGMARILGYRDSLNALDQYRKNVNSAKGWLGLADNTLQQTQDIITRISELTVQAANGSLTGKDRRIISKEVRQLFDQLLALANTTYENKSIFAGHRFLEPAYEKGMAVFSNKRKIIRVSGSNVEVNTEGSEEATNDSNGLEGVRVIDPVVPFIKTIQGIEDSVIKIKFSEPTSSDGRATVGTDTINYSYKSLDGEISGSGTITPTNTTLDLSGVTVELRRGLEVVVDSDLAGEDKTVLYVAPTAIYKGDDNNLSGIEVKGNRDVRVTPLEGSFNSNILVRVVNNVAIGDGNDIQYQYSTDGGVTWSDTMFKENPAGSPLNPVTLDLPGGTIQLRWVGNPLLPSAGDLTGLLFETGGIEVEQSNSDIHAVAYGDIKNDILVRIDEDVNLALNVSFKYSYSTDGGKTWVTENQSSTIGSDGYYHLAVPSGILKLSPAGQNLTLSQGSTFVIKPRRADLETEISKNHFIEINQIGKDIFGGFYQNASGLEPVFESNEKQNLFLTISRLVIALENNDQRDISNCLSYLDETRELLSNWQVKVGAKENRINTTDEILNNLKVNEEERKSYIEDVDFAKLITDISKTQTVYQAILKSASMIMRVSLVNYI